jgi:hypothetical protein
VRLFCRILPVLPSFEKLSVHVVNGHGQNLLPARLGHEPIIFLGQINLFLQLLQCRLGLLRSLAKSGPP